MVFGPKSTSAQLFSKAIKPSTERLLQAVNVAVLAYGMTSSGKTHTMFGTEEEPGLVPLAC
jgi:centromeric protein E